MIKNILSKNIHSNLITKIFLQIILLLGSINLFSADGDLDTTFNPSGSGPTQPGTVFTTIGTTARVQSIAIQSDGKIVAAGFANDSGSNQFTLARYNTDGSLDASFGTGGIVTTIIGANSIISSVTIQSDGKIVVGGRALVGINQFALARYNSDGSLDDTFGTSGIVLTSVSLSSNEISSIKIQSDGKIVAGGVAGNQFGLARYNADGSLDSSFGTGGTIITNIGASSSITSIALQLDGKILAGGTATISGVTQFTLARYNTDGSLDGSFGVDGIVSTIIGTSSGITSIAIQANGKIIAGGNAIISATSQFALVRYNTDGSLDSSFGSNGIAISSFSTASFLRSIALQSDGKIVAGGTSSNQFAVVRYNSNGSTDSSFGVSGIVITTIDSATLSQINSILIQANSKIVAGGFATISTNKFALARYLANTTLIQSEIVLAIKAKYCGGA